MIPKGRFISAELVTAKTGITEENIWIASTYAITTPHEPKEEPAKSMLLNSVVEATTCALDQVIANFQPTDLFQANTSNNLHKDSGMKRSGTAQTVPLFFTYDGCMIGRDHRLVESAGQTHRSYCMITGSAVKEYFVQATSSR